MVLIPINQQRMSRNYLTDKQWLMDKGIPLRSSKITGDIFESQVKCTIEQTYTNNYRTPIETEYRFTLDNAALINSFKIIIGDRTLNGVFNEKQKAKASYTDAVSSGKRASLLEKNGNVYVIYVGNLMPEETVIIQYTYVSCAVQNSSDDDLLFVFPTNIAPKYDTVKTEYENIEYSVPTTDMYTFDFNLRWESRNKIMRVWSPTHNIESDNDSNYVKNIKMTTVPTQGDFAVRAKLTSGTSLYFHKSIDGFVYVQTSIKLEYERMNKPKKYIVVVDRSGSMDGDKMNHTKEALKTFLSKLTPDDMINIISFGSSNVALLDNAVDCIPDNIKFIANEILSFSADMGGTELSNCISNVVNGNTPNHKYSIRTPNRVRKEGDPETVCIILTDGDVGRIDTIKTIIKHGKNVIRFFVIGIGKDLNRHCIEGIAKIGNGISRVVNDSTNIDEVVSYIHTMSSAKYYVDLVNNVTTDVEKILYPDRVFNYYFRMSEVEFKNLSIDGITFTAIDAVNFAKKTWHFHFDDVFSCDESLMTLYGGFMIRRAIGNYEVSRYDADFAKIFTHAIYEKMMVEMSMRYKLVSDFVSLVAIDDEVVNETKNVKKVNVPHYLKDGNMLLSVNECDLLSANSGRRSNRVNCSYRSPPPDMANQSCAIKLCARASPPTREPGVLSLFASSVAETFTDTFSSRPRVIKLSAPAHSSSNHGFLSFVAESCSDACDAVANRAKKLSSKLPIPWRSKKNNTDTDADAPPPTAPPQTTNKPYESDKMDTSGKYPIDVRCPHYNHQCIPMIMKQYTCDVCNTSNTQPNFSFRCDSCNYDICITCFLTKGFKWDHTSISEIICTKNRESISTFLKFENNAKFTEFAEAIHIDHDETMSIIAGLYYANVLNLVTHIKEMSQNPNVKHLVDTFFSYQKYIASERDMFNVSLTPKLIAGIYAQVQVCTGIVSKLNC